MQQIPIFFTMTSSKILGQSNRSMVCGLYLMSDLISHISYAGLYHIFIKGKNVLCCKYTHKKD